MDRSARSSCAPSRDIKSRPAAVTTPSPTNPTEQRRRSGVCVVSGPSTSRRTGIATQARSSFVLKGVRLQPLRFAAGSLDYFWCGPRLRRTGHLGILLSDTLEARTSLMTTSNTISSPPLGALVDSAPAKAPQLTTLTGRFVTLVPLDPEAHGGSLY